MLPFESVEFEIPVRDSELFEEVPGCRHRPTTAGWLQTIASEEGSTTDLAGMSMVPVELFSFGFEVPMGGHSQTSASWSQTIADWGG